jgi:hypothetical protein
MKVTIPHITTSDGQIIALLNFTFEVPSTISHIICTGVEVEAGCRFCVTFKWQSKGRLHTHRVYSMSNESRDALQAAMVLSA